MPGKIRRPETPSKHHRRRYLAGCLLVLIAICLAPAVAHSDDHDEAKRLRETGEILPLQEVLRRHRNAVGSRILDVELDQRRGRYVYKVESLDKRGKVQRHYFDATTGRSLGSRKRK